MASVQLPLDEYERLRAPRQPEEQGLALTSFACSAVVKAELVELRLTTTLLSCSERPVDVKLHDETLTVVESKITPPESRSDKVHCLHCAKGHICALLDGRGEYRIELLATMPLTLKPQPTFKLSVPKAVTTKFQLSIPGDGYEVKVGDRGVAATLDNDGCSQVDLALAPTNQISVQWSQAKPQNDADLQASQPERVIASQYVVYTVGETHLMMSSSFRYLLENTSRKELRLVVPRELRVVAVHSEALQEWRLVDEVPSAPGLNGNGREWSTMKEADNSCASGTGRPTALLLLFKYNVTERTVVTVNGEMELPSGSSDVSSAMALSVPLLRTSGANRERGHVTVEATANMEVQETAIGGLQPMDPKDLPPEMKVLAPSPVLSYKYFDPRCSSLSLSITKHNDTEVLVTAIDESHFESTVAQEGKVLTRCLLKVRNTQRQFLRATLPKGATIWSTLVAGVATKPCVDREGCYLIGLRKRGAQSADEEFVVELMYLTEEGADRSAKVATGMAGHGRLELTFPVFDIPINHLFVTARLPRNFKYSEFKGTLSEVKEFSQPPTIRSFQANQGGQVPIAQTRGVMHHKRGVNLFSNADRYSWNASNAAQLLDRDDDLREQSISMDSGFGLVEQEKEDFSLDAKGLLGGAGILKKAGVTPVRVALPKVGKVFLFEKLLVVAEPLSVTVNFKEQKRGFFARRNLW